MIKKLKPGQSGDTVHFSVNWAYPFFLPRRGTAVLRMSFALEWPAV
jgi:hypothetical protein